MLTPFATDTITVIRPAWTDERGDTIPDWGNATEHPETGCSVQPAVGDELLTAGRDAVTRKWSLFAPATADVTELDRVRHQGVEYDVDGDVRHWQGAIPGLSHIEATLTRVEG